MCWLDKCVSAISPFDPILNYRRLNMSLPMTELTRTKISAGPHHCKRWKRETKNTPCKELYFASLQVLVHMHTNSHDSNRDGKHAREGRERDLQEPIKMI